MLPRFASLIAALALTLAACGDDVAEKPAVMDAERYRVEIEALDALVFSHLPLNEGVRNVISMAFGGLAAKIAYLERSRGARSLSRAFRSLSEQVRQDSLSQASLRHQWLTLRKDAFSYAEWFRYVDPGTGRRLLRPPRPADLAAAERVLGNLEELIVRANRDIAGFSETSFNGDSKRLDRAYLQSWKDWADAWPKAIDEVMRELPEAPGHGVNMDYLIAHARLGYAAESLKAAVSSNWALPFQSGGEQQFAVAQIHLDCARETLRSLAASGD